jgi:hypothetical protein
MFEFLTNDSQKTAPGANSFYDPCQLEVSESEKEIDKKPSDVYDPRTKALTFGTAAAISDVN